MAPALLERDKARRNPDDKSGKGDDLLFEVVNGQIVELSDMSSYSNQVANILLSHLFRFVDIKQIGTVLSEALFSIPNSNDQGKQRRPDLAYVSNERWPINQRAPESDPWPVVPNLAIEVNSPNDLIREINKKITEYFEAGVELVWVVDPSEETVSVYSSPRQVNILSKTDTLDGGKVIQGFTLPLTQLFR